MTFDKAIEKAGGKIVVPAKPIPGYGRKIRKRSRSNETLCLRADIPTGNLVEVRII